MTSPMQDEYGDGFEDMADVYASELPEVHELAQEQTAAAIHRLHEDTSNFPRFPIPSLDGLAGAMAPDELWVVLGRQGNGKTLFFQNVTDWLVEQGVKTLYMGTEQDAHVLRIKQACVRAGVKARLILKPREHEKFAPAYIALRTEFRAAKAAENGALVMRLHEQLRAVPEEARYTYEYRESLRAVESGIAWLDSYPVRQVLWYANTRYIDRDTLAKWTTGGVRKYGVECVIVDHLHHMKHGAGRNPVEELTETVHLAKDLACAHHIPMLVASQVRRPSDPFKRYTPPEAEDAGGASGIERTADVMLSLWRPLRTDLPLEELRDLQRGAKHGTSSEDRIYQADTMGVRLVKDRLGDAPGKQTMLGVEQGKLVEIPERDHYKTTMV